MKLKISTSILFFLLIINNSQAQDVLKFAGKMFSFFSILDKSVDTYFDKEDAKQLHRKLNYFETDLEDYLKYRKELLDSLNINNYQLKDKERGHEQVRVLSSKFYKLTGRLTEIQNVAKRHFPDSIISQLRRNLRVHESQQGYLSELENFFYGQNISIKILKNEGNSIYAQLNESLVVSRKINNRIILNYKLKPRQ